LQLADGNRTTTAEILGLSRQSLYAKLDRYSIGEREQDSEET
jgi:DNA-binding NtrC family response regulator